VTVRDAAGALETLKDSVLASTAAHLAAEVLPRANAQRRQIQPKVRCLLPVALMLALAVMTGCSGGSTGVPAAAQPSVPEIHIPTETAGLAATAPDGRGAIRPLSAPTGCTATATDPDSAKQALSKASPGDKVCITGDLSGWRMKINYSGTEQAPVRVVGGGHTRVNGIDVQAGNVIVDGFTVLNATSPAIALFGNNITMTSPPTESANRRRTLASSSSNRKGLAM
jgi:hypothetical protein